MSGAELSAGEAEICGTQVKVVVEGHLRSVFSRDGTDMAQVVFPTDNGWNGFQAVIVPRRLVRMPGTDRGGTI
jgi:hypothetical protein